MFFLNLETSILILHIDIILYNFISQEQFRNTMIGNVENKYPTTVFILVDGFYRVFRSLSNVHIIIYHIQDGFQQLSNVVFASSTRLKLDWVWQFFVVCCVVVRISLYRIKWVKLYSFTLLKLTADTSKKMLDNITWMVHCIYILSVLYFNFEGQKSRYIKLKNPF